MIVITDNIMKHPAYTHTHTHFYTIYFLLNQWKCNRHPQFLVPLIPIWLW